MGQPHETVPDEPSVGQLRCIPQDILGGPVAAELDLHRSRDQAFVVRHIAAYPDGFSFLLVLRLREPRKSFHAAVEGMMSLRPSTQKGPRKIHLSVSFADGTEIGTGYAGMSGESPVLEMRGGSGSDSYWESEFWCPRLPARGNVTFRLDWPAAAIENANVILDGKLLRQAAKEARPLWESDEPPTLA